MMGSVLSIAAGSAICFIICKAAGRYTDKYCRDNEPTVWIWLDDEPESGSKVKEADDVLLMRFALGSGAI